MYKVPNQQQPLFARYAGPAADLLTLSRALLGVAIGVAGLLGGAEALATAVVLLVLAWSTDLLDGKVARLDPQRKPGWIARHDAEADLAVGLGVFAYLIASGYLAAWIGAILVVLVLIVWARIGRGLGWPLYAIGFLLLLIAVARERPLLLLLVGAYLLLALLLNWRRIFRDYLPEFFAAVRKLLGTGGRGSGTNA